MTRDIMRVDGTTNTADVQLLIIKLRGIDRCKNAPRSRYT